MEVISEQVDPCTIVLDISVDEQQVARAFDSTYREFSRMVNVPGFRPGKAPRAILEDIYAWAVENMATIESALERTAQRGRSTPRRSNGRRWARPCSR